ncbi:hypothetical protein DMI62_17960 [Escherichia coli]|nr:hypothetical protein [Escherichia coli]
MAGQRAGKRGIGRPSTCVDHFDYSGSWLCASRKSSFLCGKMGEIVTDRPEENFRELMNYDFTAQMENSLDRWQITKQSGKLYWITSSRISPSS